MTRVRLASEGRRRAIVEAAAPLFARNGFAGTTTKAIARAAGVSEALVFQHFPSKEALYREIVDSGCKGDPGFEQFLALPPSTGTLVLMIHLLFAHFVDGTLGDPEETVIDHRLTMLSYLEDGEYVRSMSAWKMQHIFPLFRDCLAAAATCGDLEPGALRNGNAFWFAHHVAATIAYARLSGTSAIPYTGALDEVKADAERFVLRGIGLSQRAIERYHVPETLARERRRLEAASRPQASPL
jgi:TetR/AcrR family transcriptional regulator, transcriptional repressor of aconitase